MSREELMRKLTLLTAAMEGSGMDDPELQDAIVCGLLEVLNALREEQMAQAGGCTSG